MAACMHAASDVFVLQKAGRPNRVARHEGALPLIIDLCPDKRADNTGPDRQFDRWRLGRRNQLLSLRR
jgi:hypothetical protein